MPSVTPVLVSFGPAALGDRARDAEVGDERLTVLQQDVLRLDVAVDDPCWCAYSSADAT